VQEQDLQNCGVTLKIRRYFVPWGFDSPSRHQDSKDDAVGVPTEEDDKARSRRSVALHATVMATVAEINRHPKRW